MTIVRDVTDIILVAVVTVVRIVTIVRVLTQVTMLIIVIVVTVVTKVTVVNKKSLSYFKNFPPFFLQKFDGKKKTMKTIATKSHGNNFQHWNFET